MLPEWRNAETLEPQPIIAKLVGTLAPGANEVMLVANAVGSTQITGQDEVVARYGGKAVIATAGLSTPDDGFVLTAFSRVASDPALADSFALIWMAAPSALSRANDLEAPADVVSAARAACSEQLVDALGAQLPGHALTLAQTVAARTREAEELAKKLATQADEEAVRRQRAQRAMLNVIEDLRE